MRRRGSLLVVLLLLFPLLGSAQAGQAALSWAGLGPPGPLAVTAIATAPDWPAGKLILASRAETPFNLPRRDDLVRTRDGGATWERLGGPAPRVRGLWILDAGGQRYTFALTGSEVQVGDQRLFLSGDEGSTWQELVSTTGQRSVPIFAPDFEAEPLGLLLVDGKLFRGGVDGSPWVQHDPVPGQRVQQAAFSPAFAVDRTIYLAVTSSDITNKPPPEPAHEQSAGLVRSTDGGSSWSVLGGPSIDDQPFRQVYDLVLSPGFPTDGVVVIAAHGPWLTEPYNGGTIQRPSAAVFRSDDRGVSWRAIETGGRSHQIVLSPSFAEDGTLLVAVQSFLFSPASSSCTWKRSTDGGATWSVVKAPGSYEGCGALRLVRGPGGLEGLGWAGQTFSWSRSPDGGATWGSLDLPKDAPMRSLAVPPNYALDGALLVGARFGGLWASGAVAATGGRLPCDQPLTAGFSRVYEGQAWARDRLGCPVEAERAVTVRERRYQDREFAVRAYWLEDNPDVLRLSKHDEYQGWSSDPKSKTPWPGDDRPLPGAVQRFEGGQMLWLAWPEGNRTILVLERPGGQYREYED